jgi:hypothetical protein
VVDGLRGIAILLVLLFHYWQLSWWTIPIPGLPAQYNLEFVQVAGYLGVELFFFISVFCLFYPHAKAMFGTGPVPTLKQRFDTTPDLRAAALDASPGDRFRRLSTYRSSVSYSCVTRIHRKPEVSE